MWLFRHQFWDILEDLVCVRYIHSTLPLLFPFLHCVCVCVCVCDFWHLATASRIVAERLAHIFHWLRTCTYGVENVHYQPYRLDRSSCGPVDSPFKYLNKTKHTRPSEKKSLCNLWRRLKRKKNNFNLLHTFGLRVCYLFIVRLHSTSPPRIFPFILFFSGVDLILHSWSWLYNVL